MGSPQQRISPSKESRSRPIRNSKTQENQDLPTAFLQNRILARVKSLRQINRFRILHGRLPKVACRGPLSGYSPEVIDVSRVLVSALGLEPRTLRVTLPPELSIAIPKSICTRSVLDSSRTRPAGR